MLQLEENGLFAEQEERVKYILKRLLLEKDYVRLEDLEADLYVSKSTLHTDLKKVRKILKKYDLTLANRPHYGTKVEGGEFKKGCAWRIPFLAGKISRVNKIPRSIRIYSKK